MVIFILFLQPLHPPGRMGKTLCSQLHQKPIKREPFGYLYLCTQPIMISDTHNIYENIAPTAHDS